MHRGISLRVLLISLVVFSMELTGTTAASASTPPPTDVSCSFVSEGVQCSNSITFGSGSSTWQVSGNPYVAWYFSLLRQGADAQYISNYGERVLQVRENPGSVSATRTFTYQQLLDFARGDQAATILVTAILFDGDGSTSPTLGRQVSLPLADVRTGMQAATPDTKPTPTPAPTATVDGAQLKILVGKLYDLVSKIDIALARYPTNAALAQLKKTLTPVIEDLKSRPTESSLNEAKLLEQQSQMIYVSALQQAMVESKVAQSKSAKKTITCVKGKLIKKVTAVNPKCPKGYKRKA